MAFPALVPTSRDYTPGDWPVKSFPTQSGAEVRIRYGNQRTNSTLALNYDNITDTSAETFLTHYNETQGTFLTFTLPSQTFTGWNGSTLTPGTDTNAAWRYASSPQVTNIRPGVSSVRVELVGVI
jgi:hypothetical protein